MLSRDFEQSCDAFDRLNLDQTDCTIDYQMVIRASKLDSESQNFLKEGKKISGATNFASIPTGIAEVRMLLREFRLAATPLLTLSDADLLPKHQKSYVSFIKKLCECFLNIFKISCIVLERLIKLTSLRVKLYLFLKVMQEVVFLLIERRWHYKIVFLASL